MLSNKSLHGWMDHLRVIYPIEALVHVGAGNGYIVSSYAEWGISCALLIEAEEALYKQLASAVEKQPGWIAHNALISDQVGDKTFFLASNPNENGVIPPENLSNLWRNLKTKEKLQLDSTTLESVINSQNTLAVSVNWGVIDCLPALQIIQGTGKLIESLDVIITRAILKEDRCTEIGATKNELDVFLGAQGFHCIALEEERQPAIASLLYIRDWKNKYRGCNVQLEAASGEKAKLVESRDQYAKLAAERQVQMEQLTHLQEEETKKYQGLQQQLIVLGKLKDEAVKQSEDLRVQLEAASGEKAKLVESRDQYAKLAAERQSEISALKVKVQEGSDRISSSELQITEQKQSLKLMNDEILRAEAQIDLIKDLLLREQGP